MVVGHGGLWAIRTGRAKRAGLVAGQVRMEVLGQGTSFLI